MPTSKEEFLAGALAAKKAEGLSAQVRALMAEHENLKREGRDLALQISEQPDNPDLSAKFDNHIAKRKQVIEALLAAGVRPTDKEFLGPNFDTHGDNAPVFGDDFESRVNEDRKMVFKFPGQTATGRFELKDGESLRDGLERVMPDIVMARIFGRAKVRIVVEVIIQ